MRRCDVNKISVRDFLIGLTKLTRETGIIISGCGCCGSPRISNTGADEAIDDHRSGYGRVYKGKVEWISPADKDKWEEYSAYIGIGDDPEQRLTDENT